MSSFFMRFTPRKTSVVLHKEPKFATEIPSSSKADEQQMLDSVAISSPVKQRQEQEDAAIASSSSTSSKNKKYYRGMEIISLPSCTIPEPRVSVVGHAFLTILWWGAFAFFGALTIFVFFFLHKNFQSVALPTMQSQNPTIPVQFFVSCTETANSWNEGDLILANRTITSILTTRYSSASVTSPSSCQSLSTSQTMMILSSSSSSTGRDANSNNNGSFTFTSLLEGTLCFEPDQPTPLFLHARIFSECTLNCPVRLFPVSHPRRNATSTSIPQWFRPNNSKTNSRRTHPSRGCVE